MTFYFSVDYSSLSLYIYSSVLLQISVNYDSSMVEKHASLPITFSDTYKHSSLLVFLAINPTY